MSVYLITGASGYIGSMLLKRLLKRESDSQVVALNRNFEKLKARFPDGDLQADKCRLPERSLSEVSQSEVNPAGMNLSERSPSFDGNRRLDFGRIRCFQADLCDSCFIDRFCTENKKVDYIIHCASATRSIDMVNHPVEVTGSIINATQNVLELARLYEIKSMVYLSSMEIYGDIDCSDGHRVTEEEAAAGRIEPLNVRSCYPLGKRMAENICFSYFKEYGVPVKIARLAQTFGRGILPSDNRIFAQIARTVKEGSDIILHTEGCSMGNYCAIDDALTGILKILECGKDGEAYNVVNEENTMSIRQMAELAASQVAKGRIGVQYDIPPENRYGYAPDTGLWLSGEKLANLGWRPEKTLADMYQEMLDDM